MKSSQFLNNTLRQVAVEGADAGHTLLLRGGYVRPLGSGLFSFTPLGLRVKNRIEHILREEMNALGAHEVSLPLVQPAELWSQSGRWDSVGDEMARFEDRGGREMCLAMTHEEAATSLVGEMVHSYRQLPTAIYQLQTKFRDEPRPRGGLLRVREFTMKDAYSFHATAEDLDEFYQRMHVAYERIFKRCGLDVVSVESDQGMMGGSGAHEFMALLSVGEDTILLCDACGYKANRQVAVSRKSELEGLLEAQLEEIATPGASTIEELASFLEVSRAATAKAVLFTAQESDGKEQLVFAVVRGDMELNETKLSNALSGARLRPATEEEISRVGAVPGYASPIGIDKSAVTVVVDEAVVSAPALVAGANRFGYHLKNTKYGRDYVADVVADIAAAAAGDACAHCGSALRAERGIEVGNIFKLGTRYSEAMGVGFHDEHSQRRPFVMGSYGIGPGRLMACVVQAHHDDRGPVWPATLAPFDVVIVQIASAAVITVAETSQELYETLSAKGVRVLLDDRDERPGVKFADADLVGAPIRVVVGEKGLSEGCVEVKRRSEATAMRVDLEEVNALLDSWLVGGARQA